MQYFKFFIEDIEGQIFTNKMIFIELLTSNNLLGKMGCSWDKVTHNDP